MATAVYYNGVEIHNVVTRQWDEECVYDASGTDLLYRRIRMRFQGLCHKGGGGYVPGGGGGVGDGWGPAYIRGTGVNEQNTTPEIFNIVRPRLLMPRQQLQVEMNGKSVLNVTGASNGKGGNNIDMDNGPKPRQAILMHVTGDQVFRLDFVIEVCIDADNSPIDGAPIGGGTVVVNNRWGITETTADNFAITRTINGNLRLSNWIDKSQDFRNVVVPPLEVSFKRESMSFAVSPNGLDCSYTITDRQVHIAAPWPACRVDGSYTESTVDGITYTGDCSVSLEGPLSASVQLMMIRAMQIIDTRLKIREKEDQGDNKTYSIEAASMTEHIGEKNAVEAHVRITHVAGVDDKEKVVSMFADGFGQLKGGVETLLDLSSYGNLPGQPKPYDVWHSQEPKLFGYLPGTQNPRQAAFLYALGCYFQDPWHPQAPAGSQQSAGTGIGSPPNTAPTVTVSGTNYPTTTKKDTKTSSESKTAEYTYARLVTRYYTVPCRVQLPIAASQEGKNPTSVFATLAAPQYRREVHYDSERIGQDPEIVSMPDTYTDGDGINATLLQAWDRALPPTLTANKKQTVHRIEGFRLYALDRPPQSGEKVKVGVLATVNRTGTENALAFSDLMSDRMKVNA